MLSDALMTGNTCRVVGTAPGWLQSGKVSPCSLEGSGHDLGIFLAGITAISFIVFLVEACCFYFVLVVVIDFCFKSSLNEPFVSFLLDGVIGKICIF